MALPRSTRTTLWLMTCVAVLVMPAVGVHMHVCLDGQEPPQSLHWGDGGVHVDADHTGGSHADVEIALLDEALAKNLASGWDMPALPETGLLFLPPLLKALAPNHDRASIQPLAREHFFRPPLRAPPA